MLMYNHQRNLTTLVYINVQNYISLAVSIYNTLDVFVSSLKKGFTGEFVS